MEITTTELLAVIQQMWDTHDAAMTTVASNVAGIRQAMTLQMQHHQEEMDALRQINSGMEGKIDHLMAHHALSSGLLPPRMNHVSRVAIQIFHKETLTTKDRQARHTHWSLKLEVSIDGRRVAKGIDLGLYPGRVFDHQVMEARDVPSIIKRYAEANRDVDEREGLFGMLNRRSEGEGTPRERSQFCVLSGHECGKPKVDLMVDDVLATCASWIPGKGRKAGRALWYGTTKPEAHIA